MRTGGGGVRINVRLHYLKFFFFFFFKSPFCVCFAIGGSAEPPLDPPHGSKTFFYVFIATELYLLAQL